MFHEEHRVSLWAATSLESAVGALAFNRSRAKSTSDRCAPTVPLARFGHDAAHLPVSCPPPYASV